MKNEKQLTIKMIEVNNFKSLVDFKLRLAKFSCLIGLNGVGKSTVLQFVDFLSQLVRGEMKEWLAEKMVFEKEPFMNVMHKLEDWYGTEIYVDGNGGELAPVTASFDHATLSDVLDKLRKQSGFKYEIKSDRVLIKF